MTVEGAVVALFYSAAAGRVPACAIAGAGYLAAAGLLWRVRWRAAGAGHGATESDGGFALPEPAALWLGAALSLAGTVAAGRLSAGLLGLAAMTLSMVVWSAGWGLRLMPTRPWVIAALGWLAAAGATQTFGGALLSGGPRWLLLAAWVCGAVLFTWLLGRRISLHLAAVEGLSTASAHQLRAYEQEQSLFALHADIEHHASSWSPSDWGEKVLKVVARLLAAHQVWLVVPGQGQTGWRLYAAWPAVAAAAPSFGSLLKLLPRPKPGPSPEGSFHERALDAAAAGAPVQAPLLLNPRAIAGSVRSPGTTEEAWGWLVASRSPWQAPFDAEHRRLLGQLSNHWNTAIQNVSAYTQSQRRAQRLVTLHEISRAMARPLQLEPLFETIFREVSRVMPAEAFIISLYEPETQTVNAAFIFDKGQRYPPLRVAADQGPTVDVIRTGRPLFINRRAEELGQPVPGRRLVGTPEEPASVIIVPMILEDRVVGAISAQAYRPEAYTLEDLELLGTIAGQAAVYVQNARLYEQTVQLALTDYMTGLGNARMLRRELGRELPRARRSGRPLSLIMIDSDDLKRINDRYGHPVGDRYLVLLADIIRSHVRAGDIVTRYAGDEFVLVLPETSMAEAERVAARIVEAAGKTPLLVGDERVYTTVSAGVASFPECGDDEDALIRAVDRALYAAKHAGKGRISCHPGSGEGPSPAEGPARTGDSAQPPA